MAVQLSVAARNARLDAIEAELITGGAPVLRLFTGAQPATCATANSGTEVATMTLPADPFAAASSGTKAKQNTWSGSGIAAGTAAHFRIYKADGTTCVIQGSVGLGTGDLSLDNNVIANGQTVTVTAYTFTDGNA
jgi:hypothetical protein